MGDRNRLGNVVGKFIGSRRRSKQGMSIAREFGMRFMDRYPGMGEYISLTLFGTSKKVASIQFTLDEIRKIAQSVSTHADGLAVISGGDGARWPIAPLYDYLLTLDQTVGDMLTEMNIIAEMGTVGSQQQAAILSRVPFPDFRPYWYRKESERPDGRGLDQTAGQALGSETYYEAARDDVAVLPSTPGFQQGVPMIRRKTAYELACDNALLLQYPHMNAVVALSQGLFRVNFTQVPRISTHRNALSSDSDVMVKPGSWVNANRKRLNSSSTANRTVADGTNSNIILSAQHTDLRNYLNNRFQREQFFRGLRTPATLISGAASNPDAYVSIKGGAMATLWTMLRTSQGRKVMRPAGSIRPPDGLGMPVYMQATTITEDMFRTAFHSKKSPIFHCQTLKEVARQVGIDRALRNLHMQMQIVFAKAFEKTTRDTYRVEDTFKLTQHVPCPKGRVRVFKDRKGNFVPEFLSTSQGTIRNPAITGTGTCVKARAAQSKARTVTKRKTVKPKPKTAKRKTTKKKVKTAKKKPQKASTRRT